MQKDLKNRIERNAKALRFISRAQMFEKNRKNHKQQLSYLRSLPENQRPLILQSLNGPIPNVLPPLSATTISYYRRSNRPVFRTKQNGKLHPHLIYQSLFLISAIEQINFSDYQSIVKQFQTDLQKYLSCQFHQIKQMATIAAGNKIIGRQKQIQKIVQLDQKQIWVLINHIYERKISYIKIFSYLKDYNQTIYKSIFEMSNTNDDDIIQFMMSDNEIVLFLISSLDHYNPDIKKYTIRILGNIMAQKQQYVYKLSNYNIINKLGSFLTSNDDQLRKDICWALANLAYEKGPSTQLVKNKQVTNRLIYMFDNQIQIKIIIELCHVFANIIAYSQKLYVFNFLQQATNILNRCDQLLQIQQTQLTLVCLYLICKIVQLNQHITQNYGKNYIHQIKYSGIKGKIIQKTYSPNTQISALSTQIQQKLQEQY